MKLIPLNKKRKNKNDWYYDYNALLEIKQAADDQPYTARMSLEDVEAVCLALVDCGYLPKTRPEL